MEPRRGPGLQGWPAENWEIVTRWRGTHATHDCEASKALVEAASAAFPGLGEGAATLEIEVPTQAPTTIGRIVVQGLALELGRHASGSLALGSSLAAMPLSRGRGIRLLSAFAFGWRARLWRITRCGLSSGGTTAQRQEVEGDCMILTDVLQGASSGSEPSGLGLMLGRISANRTHAALSVRSTCCKDGVSKCGGAGS